jgi:hypothetical protein
LYEAVASNDSILHVASMSEVARVLILKIILTPKKKDEEKKDFRRETTRKAR